MEHTPRKKRGPWIDLALITSILTLLSLIILFLVSDDENGFSKSQITAAEPLIDSTITKENSTFPGIHIISDISNDHKVPFSIQYPQIEDEKFNSIIEEYIQASKRAYINDMHKDKNKDSGTTRSDGLTIQFDTYQHDNKYFSFVFTERISKNTEEIKTKIKTVFYDMEAGKILDIRTLLGEDTKSLETFANHVRARLKTSPSLQKTIQKEKVDLATEPRWILFDQFAVHNDDLLIYFDEGTIAPAEDGPISINISLSFLNPLLASEFQTQMIEAEKAPGGQAEDQKKRVALTFDDGPHPQVTLQILQCLEKYKAKATFFMLGSRVQQYPDIALKVKNNGHELGNHTWSHPILPKLTEAQIMQEFTTTEKAIFDATGQEATVFRPPYGATSEAINQKIPKDSVLWSIDTLDWKHKNAEKLIAQVKQHMHNNAIILMHDIHQSTADALPAVLDFLSKEGYEFVTVSEILPYR